MRHLNKLQSTLDNPIDALVNLRYLSDYALLPEGSVVLVRQDLLVSSQPVFLFVAVVLDLDMEKEKKLDRKMNMHLKKLLR